MRFRVSLVVSADDFSFREGGVIEAADLDDAMEQLLSKAPEPPDDEPEKVSLHIVIERMKD